MSDVITACPIGVVIVAESCIRWRRFSSTQYGERSRRPRAGHVQRGAAEVVVAGVRRDGQVPETRHVQTVVPVARRRDCDRRAVLGLCFRCPLPSEHAAAPAHVRGTVWVIENDSCQFVAV